MNAYDRQDEHGQEREPLIPEPKEPRFQVLTTPPEIDGVPCAPEGKRFHDQAQEVMAGEEASNWGTEPTHNELVAWRLEVIKRTLATASSQLHNAVQILKTLQPKDMPRDPEKNAEMVLYSAGRLIEELARLHGRDYVPPLTFVLMDIAKYRDESPSCLRERLEAAVDLERRGQSDREASTIDDN